jgi:hypothetical protein
MKNFFIAGVLLVIAGAAILGFNQFSYTTTEEILKLGPITASAQNTHTVTVPAILGWLLVVGGAGILVFALSSKKD